MARWIERQRHLLDFTLVSLGRLKGKNLALVLTLTLLVFGLESAMLFSQALEKEAGRLLRGTPEVLVQRLTAGGHRIAQCRPDPRLC
jgi:hypothetical protein